MLNLAQILVIRSTCWHGRIDGKVGTCEDVIVIWLTDISHCSHNKHRGDFIYMCADAAIYCMDGWINSWMNEGVSLCGWLIKSVYCRLSINSAWNKIWIEHQGTVSAVSITYELLNGVLKWGCALLIEPKGLFKFQLTHWSNLLTYTSLTDWFTRQSESILYNSWIIR